MENKFKIKKGLEINGSLGTLLDVQGDYGQLFSVTDSLTGDLFSVSDISGAPILNVNSDGTVTIDGPLTGTSATFTGNIHLDNDSSQLQFGDDNDMQIYHNGADGRINNTLGNFKIDSAGDITLDADGGDIRLYDGSVLYGNLANGAGHFQIKNPTQNMDISFIGNDGGSNVTALTLDMSEGGNATFAGTISSPQKIFHAAAVGANYVKIYRAEGTASQIAGTVRISGTAHGGSHVSNFTAYVVVNHSGDILVKSFSGNYTQVSIKVESDGNEDYHLSIKSIVATSTPTYYFTIEALTDKLTLTKAPTSTPSTTATHEHTTKFGLNITGVGGDMRNGITGDLAVIGDISAQGIEVTGDITMSTASQLIFPDNSSIPDNPTNEKHDYIRFNSGSISQISGRVGLMLTSQDDSLVLANGDVGKSFVNTNINVDAEEIYMLSDNSVQLITDLQDGWDGSPSPYYTHQFVGGEHTRTNSSGGSVTFFHTGSENVMRYKGIVAGDWDTIFSQTDGHMGVYEVQNIVGGTGAGAHSNYPSGSYSYGGVMSWQLANSTFKLYAPHTGTLWYQTGWNNDEYSGWRKVFDNSHVIPSANLDADTAHLSGNQTFSGIKTFDAGIKFGNCSINKSGDSNHIHVTCPNALIPNSTTLANNTRLGTSAYRWKDFYAGPGNFLGSVTASADVIAYSDARLKENVKTLDGSKVLKMRGVSFDRKDTGISSSGVIAQEMQKVAPELVSDDDGTLGVAYGNLTGYLIEAIKEQQKQIDELKSQMAACNKTACNCNCKN